MNARPKGIGEVIFLSEKMAVAREISSCCVGTEAYLETGSFPANRRFQQSLFPNTAIISRMFRRFFKAKSN